MSQFRRPLSREFYDHNPRRVSRDLLGKVLVRKEADKLLAARIVEVEAYLGENDPAAHSFAGRTPRNAVLFGPPGYAYVYFIYGNHYCLNVSCLPDGVAGGILFRAAEPLAGMEEMAEARNVSFDSTRDSTRNSRRDLRKLTSGPGRLAEAFGITRERDNGKDLTSARSDLFITDDGYRAHRILTTPRIGITKAAGLPLRYVIAGNEFVSGPKIGNSRQRPDPSLREG
jgi:DNA-3-methyladenine glycosylase